MEQITNDALLTILEAAAISGKSIQTIRRAIKSKNVKVKRRKTPQGFNYLISKNSLISFYDVKESKDLREIPVEGGTDSTIRMDIHDEARGNAAETPVKKLYKELDGRLNGIVQQYAKEREQLTDLLKDFQDRMMVMENQVRMLQAPRKRWYQVWK